VLRQTAANLSPYSSVYYYERSHHLHVLETWMPDTAAVRRLKTGDLHGLEELIARHQTRALRAAFLIVHDAELAQDIVQDTFLALSQQIASFDETRPFAPYLLRSVVNRALNVAQREARLVAMTADDEGPAVEALLAHAAAVEDRVIAAQLQEELLLALERLPVKQRAAIVQRYYLEMSEAEMAASLDVAPGTIKWLLHTARARLRALLGSPEAWR
jgi:RNA polymerase sigma-70 factor (ECF subfamily)